MLFIYLFALPVTQVGTFFPALIEFSADITGEVRNEQFSDATQTGLLGTLGQEQAS